MDFEIVTASNYERILLWNVRYCSLVQMLPENKTSDPKRLHCLGVLLYSCSLESAVCLTFVYVSILNCTVKLKNSHSWSLDVNVMRIVLWSPVGVCSVAWYS